MLSVLCFCCLGMVCLVNKSFMELQKSIDLSYRLTAYLQYRLLLLLHIALGSLVRFAFTNLIQVTID